MTMATQEVTRLAENLGGLDLGTEATEATSKPDIEKPSTDEELKEDHTNTQTEDTGKRATSRTTRRRRRTKKPTPALTEGGISQVSRETAETAITDSKTRAGTLRQPDTQRYTPTHLRAKVSTSRTTDKSTFTHNVFIKSVRHTTLCRIAMRPLNPG